MRALAHLLPLLALLLLVPLASHVSAQEDDVDQQPAPRTPDFPFPVGNWSGWLVLGGGHQLYFEFEVQDLGDGTYRTFLSNASERIEVPRTTWILSERGAPVLRLAFPHYDAVLRATLQPNRRALTGWYVRQRGEEPPRKLQFVGAIDKADRFPEVLTPGVFRSVSGRWEIRFEDQAEPGVMILEQKEQDSYVEGTILTTTGDYRFLEGRCDRGHLRLSTFDAAHAFLITGGYERDDTLSGTFKSGSWYTVKWTARRAPDAQLANPLHVTRWHAGAQLADLAFPQLDGTIRSLAAPEWAGRPTIVNLFGSWCPNCHDEAELLNELHATYGPQGLAVLGLAFETPGSTEDAINQVARFRLLHQTSYTTLLAGTTPKPRSTRQLGVLDELRSYPTSIFVRRDGSIAGVHTGFVGPAAGHDHTLERARFEELTQEILASPAYDAEAAAMRFAETRWTGPAGKLDGAATTEAHCVPGGVWLGEQLLRVDLAHGVAWNTTDLDRCYRLEGAAPLGLDDLASPELARRRAALLALAIERGPDGAFPEALPLLEDPVPLVATAAAWALGYTRTAAAREGLKAHSGDEFRALAHEATRALTRLP